MILFGYCFKCGNKGYNEKATDERVPYSEETDMQKALRMLEGGRWFKLEKIPCSDLDNPKHK